MSMLALELRPVGDDDARGPDVAIIVPVAATSYHLFGATMLPLSRPATTTDFA